MPLDLEKIDPKEHEFSGEEIGKLLVESVKQIKAGQIGNVRQVAVNNAIEARRKTGLSQTDFAQIMGISVRTLQSWEQGARTPSGPAAVLLKIATKHPETLMELRT